MCRFIRRHSLSLLATVAFATAGCLVPLAASPPAAAQPVAVSATSPSPSHVLHWFIVWGADQVPLRYGNLKYGYRHIRFRRGGYNARTQRSIQAVLLGYNAWELQGNTVVYFQYRGRDEYVVVVGINTIKGELGQTGQGVITYYRQRRRRDRRRRPRPKCDEPSQCPCPPSHA